MISAWEALKVAFVVCFLIGALTYAAVRLTTTPSDVRYKSAYDLGKNSYLSQVSSESNPFAGSNNCADMSVGWLQGWMDAKKEASNGLHH